MSITRSTTSSVTSSVSSSITGGTPPIIIENAYIIEVQTDNAGISANNQFAMPLWASGSYNFTVEYNGSIIKTVTSYLDNVITFPDGAGTKIIKLTGMLHDWSFNNTGDKDKMLWIHNWGTGFRFGNNPSHYMACVNLRVDAIDIPDLTGQITFVNMFRRTSIDYIPNINLWPTGLIEQFALMFYNNANLAADFSITGWDTSSGKNFTGMFGFCPNYIGVGMNTLDYSNATSITGLLQGTSFDSNIDITIPNVIVASSALPTISTANYDSFLINLAAQLPNLKTNVNFGASGSKYSAGAAANAKALVESSKSWVFSDGGLAP